MKELDHVRPATTTSCMETTVSYDFFLRVLLLVIMIAFLLNLRVPSVWLAFLTVKELPFDQQERNRLIVGLRYFLYRTMCEFSWN
jgi:hypothetical protein